MCMRSLQNLKFVALPVLEIIAIEILGGVCEPQILGKRRPYGVATVVTVQFERALMTFYRHCP